MGVKQFRLKGTLSVPNRLGAVQDRDNTSQEEAHLLVVYNSQYIMWGLPYIYPNKTYKFKLN